LQRASGITEDVLTQGGWGKNGWGGNDDSAKTLQKGDRLKIQKL
jgi:hypothetical protein